MSTNEKCFCHLADRNGNEYAVKDAYAREKIREIEEDFLTEINLNYSILDEHIQEFEPRVTALENASAGKLYHYFVEISSRVTTGSHDYSFKVWFDFHSNKENYNNTNLPCMTFHCAGSGWLSVWGRVIDVHKITIHNTNKFTVLYSSTVINTAEVKEHTFTFDAPSIVDENNTVPVTTINVTKTLI